MATSPGSKKHLDNLEFCCRVCGPVVENGKSKLIYRKSLNDKLMFQVYGIDVKTDTVLHPEYICVNCFNVNRSFLKSNRNKR